MPERPHKTLIDLDAHQFLERSATFLYQQEDIYSHLLSLAAAAGQSPSPFHPPFWFATVLDAEGNTLACAVHANPDGLICTDLNEATALEIASEFRRQYGCPHRVSGPPSSVALLKNFFDEAKSKSLSTERAWTIFRIDRAPNYSQNRDGRLQIAQPDDEALIREWGKSYEREKPAFLSIEEYLVTKLKRRELYKWVQGGTKCIIAMSGRTKNGVRISALYTPPNLRGHGYATFAVSSLVDMALSDGVGFVTLHAQREDSIERLYERIGFRAIGQYYSSNKN